MTSQQPHPQPKDRTVDMQQLEEYLFKRASEFQKREFWVSSFEDLYLLTVLNQGYYWDTEGRKQILRATHAPAAPAERLCDECNIIELEERLINLEQDLKDARKDEREQVLDVLEEFLNSDDHLSLFKWEVREQIRYLRGGVT